MEQLSHGAWYALLSPREQATIDHALAYAKDFANAGVPGHSAHLLIAKLALEIDKATVGVTAAVAPTESIDDAISAIEDIAELVGWPSIDTDRADDNFVITFKRGGL